jgi:PPOX class probable F420-dependent enzyme
LQKVVTVQLATADYFKLATFRKNGNAVETPVWFAPHGDTFYVFSAGDAGKVKRIRVSGRARVAACDVRGKLTGEWSDAHARLVNDGAEIETAYVALRRKYGLRMATLDFFAKLSGRYQRRQMIAVNLAPSVVAPRAAAARVTAP